MDMSDTSDRDPLLFLFFFISPFSDTEFSHFGSHSQDTRRLFRQVTENKAA